MKKAILGRKIGMTQIFDENGSVVPVTVVKCEPSVVIGKKETEKDGYESVVIGFENIREKLVNSPRMGQFKKAGVTAKRFIKEFKLDDLSAYEIGSEIKVDTFEAGEKVDVTGTSKGKGFQGVIKRWNFKIGPKSHGSKFRRAPGSQGAASDPSRTFKNRKMPGHMGNVKRTVMNLEVVKVMPEQDIILIKGGIPGPRKGLLFIKDTVKR